jgi:hypothetical protein
MGEPRDGWHLVALAGELTEPVTPLALGSRALVAVRIRGPVRIFDAACPHRGAHLGHGGTLTRSSAPFTAGESALARARDGCGSASTRCSTAVGRCSSGWPAARGHATTDSRWS